MGVAKKKSSGLKKSWSVRDYSALPFPTSPTMSYKYLPGELGTGTSDNAVHKSILPFSSRVIRSLVRHVKYFLGLRFDVSVWEHLQTEGPYVTISNHQSSLDVLGRS